MPRHRIRPYTPESMPQPPWTGKRLKPIDSLLSEINRGLDRYVERVSCYEVVVPAVYSEATYRQALDILREAWPDGVTLFGYTQSSLVTGNPGRRTFYLYDTKANSVKTPRKARARAKRKVTK